MVDKKNMLKIAKIALDVITNDDNAKNEIVIYYYSTILILVSSYWMLGSPLLGQLYQN